MGSSQLVLKEHLETDENCERDYEPTCTRNQTMELVEALREKQALMNWLNE